MSAVVPAQILKHHQLCSHGHGPVQWCLLGLDTDEGLLVAAVDSLASP